MLSREENELLTHVGRGTPMGDLLRQFWIPALLSRELPEPDGEPMRVRLLGEDVVAFRASNGQIGLLGNHCPHRGASLGAIYDRSSEHLGTSDSGIIRARRNLLLAARRCATKAPSRRASSSRGCIGFAPRQWCSRASTIGSKHRAHSARLDQV